MAGGGKFAMLLFCIFVCLYAMMSCTKNNRRHHVTIYAGRTIRDTIYTGETIRDGETIVSAQGSFELGFFSPCNSTNRYVGIWSGNYSSTPVVAAFNVDTPLTNTSGELSLTHQGSLVIRYANGHVVWSTETIYERELVGQLLDNGSFIIRGWGRVCVFN